MRSARPGRLRTYTALGSLIASLSCAHQETARSPPPAIMHEVSPPAPTPPPVQMAPPVSDQALIDSIDNLLVLAGLLPARFEVSSRGGKVRIVGEVPDAEIMVRLPAAISDLKGVKSVSDDLKISTPVETGEEIPSRSLLQLAYDLFKPLLVMILIGAVLIAILYGEYYLLRERPGRRQRRHV